MDTIRRIFWDDREGFDALLGAIRGVVMLLPLVLLVVLLYSCSVPPHSHFDRDAPGCTVDTPADCYVPD
jgi:hypothetical protein